jgi:hypothetical protein
MENFDRHDELAIRHLDDVALEEVRLQMVADRDSRLDVVIRELVLRAVRVIESVCRTQGEGRGLSRQQILKSIEDASARLLLRLARHDRQPAVTAVAAEIAGECVAAQAPETPAPPRLATRQPRLRVVEQLGEALKRGRVRRNNWRNS